MKKEEKQKLPRKTKEEKLKIIKEASIHGVRETLNKSRNHSSIDVPWRFTKHNHFLLSDLRD